MKHCSRIFILLHEELSVHDTNKWRTTLPFGLTTSFYFVIVVVRCSRGCARPSLHLDVAGRQDQELVLLEGVYYISQVQSWHASIKN